MLQVSQTVMIKFSSRFSSPSLSKSLQPETMKTISLCERAASTLIIVKDAVVPASHNKKDALALFSCNLYIAATEHPTLPIFKAALTIRNHSCLHRISFWVWKTSRHYWYDYLPNGELAMERMRRNCSTRDSNFQGVRNWFASPKWLSMNILFLF